MAMKINELMIGDWVRFKENYPQKELQGKIAKVKGVRGRIDVRTQDGEYYESEHPDWLEPIKLTEEILVKNGWDFTKSDYSVYCKEDTNGDAELSKDQYGFYWSINCDEYVILRIDYVHQLQHLLRLCGIEK
jgi:hypothetical protein